LRLLLLLPFRSILTQFTPVGLLAISLFAAPGLSNALTIEMDQKSFVMPIIGPCGTCPGLASTVTTIDFISGVTDGVATRLDFETSLPFNEIENGIYEPGFDLFFDTAITDACTIPAGEECGSPSGIYTYLNSATPLKLDVEYSQENPGLERYAFFVEFAGIPAEMVVAHYATVPFPGEYFMQSTMIRAIPEPSASMLFLVGLLVAGTGTRGILAKNS
jgi:hypothetical protein